MWIFCLLRVFFFKQKTAYDMRISDWSSDVCSSDLVGPCAAAPVRVLLQGAAEAADQHLAHHAVVVAGHDLAGLQPRRVADAADLELAVGVLHQAFRPGDDHAADRPASAEVPFFGSLAPLRPRFHPAGARDTVAPAA